MQTYVEQYPGGTPETMVFKVKYTEEYLFMQYWVL